MREACFLRKRIVKKTPTRTKQNNSWNQDVTVYVERKSEERNKTQNERLQRDRRLWNGNTKSKQLVIKKMNNQTATKPSIQGQRQNLEGCSSTEEMRTYGPPSCNRKKNPARREYKLMSFCFQSHIDTTVFFKLSHSMLCILHIVFLYLLSHSQLKKSNIPHPVIATVTDKWNNFHLYFNLN